MSEIRQKELLRKFYFSYGIVALIVYALLMVFAFPWWHTSNHPVIVTIKAGSEQNMELAFGKDEAPLKLVPIGEQLGHQWKWGTELPPRSSYELSLLFPEGTIGDVVLEELEVIRLRPEKIRSFIDGSNLKGSEEGLVRLKRSGGGHQVFAEPGGRLSLNVSFPEMTPYDWMRAWFQASYGFIVVAVMFMLLIVTVLRFPDGVRAYRRRTPAHEVVLLLLIVGVGAYLHIELVRNSMPALSSGESDAYFFEALSDSDEAGTLSGMDTSHIRPGYPFLLNLVLGEETWDLGRMALVQAAVFCVAVLLLALSFSRLVQAYLLGPFLLLSLVSPPVVWASRHMGIESAMLSGWILSLALFLWIWQRGEWARWVGFFFFGLAVASSAAVSVEGLVLLGLPVGLMIGTVWWCISIRGIEFWKMRLFWRTLGQTGIVFIVLGLSSLILTKTHPEAPGLCEIPDSKFSAGFVSGMFDIRAVSDEEAYREIINERVANGYRYDGPAMSKFMDLSETSRGLLPLQAKLVGWGRLSGWAIFFPKLETFAMNPLNADYRAHMEFSSTKEGERVRTSLTTIMRETGKLVQIKEKRYSKQINSYNKIIVPKYIWFYRVLLLLAIAGWLVGLSERKYLAGILLIPFLLNLILHVVILSVSSQHMQPFDFCLWLAALSGLVCIDRKAMQKPTDESDRRCIPPIRPKRLFTRYKAVPRNTPPPM